MEERIILPSNGLFYEGIPCELTIRSLTTKEEQLLYGSTSDTTIDKIIQGCIVEPQGYPLDDLIPADKLYILFKIRILTYGQMYNQYIFCPYCNFEGSTEVDLDTLPCTELNEEEIKVPLRLTLPVSKDIVELKVLTESDYKFIKERANKLSRQYNKPFNQFERRLRFAKQILSVNGNKYDVFMAEKYYDSMHVKDVRYIDSALFSIKVGYQSKLETRCPSCNRDILVPFEMTSEFLMPTFRNFDWN
jgi:hypothetical protein